ncbi:MAG TPA: glycosyl hydrolase [Terracidiphilus sp.]|jgi:mannan endo-1,4-beta-mannosidase
MVRIAAAILAVAFGCGHWAQAAPEPVNPHASPEARALLAYLDSISGQAFITGQHNYPNDGSRFTDLAYDLTGKYPGLFGQDFGFSAGDDKDSVLSRPAMIQEAERQYRNGAIIALTWHAVRPTDDEPVTFRDSVQGHLTDYEWQQLLTPGTPLYNRWCAQVDVIAGYLRQLRDAHVPVLFRAYHEMNGNWFWWGGRPGKDGSAALYRQIYDRFVNVHHLDNLVWVWNVNAPGGSAGPVAYYFPGAQFADVVSIDIYGEFKQEYYDSMITFAAGKPIALAEVGGMPSPDVLDKQPLWTYFMTWSEFVQMGNTLDQANAVFHYPRALNRDDPRLAGPMAAIRKATADRTAGKPDADPVTPGALAESKAMLNRLVAATGEAVLSGQQNDPASPAAATAAVAQAAGKTPAIYGTELEGAQPGSSPAEVSRAIVEQAIRAHKSQALVSLSWHPSRPTDNAPASAHGALSDFEWAELLTPGTALNKRWAAQVDQAAETLRELQKAGIAVLWNPYPESNGKNSWWAGRKGVHGSAELYRMLFDRLVNHDGLHNLLWVWEPAAPSFNSADAAPFSDFFPGYLYTDALQISLRNLNARFRIDGMLAQFALGKPIGVQFTGNPPDPEAVAGHASWAWFLVAPLASATPDTARDDALRKLYADPHVASLPAAQ